MDSLLLPKSLGVNFELLPITTIIITIAIMKPFELVNNCQ